MEVLVFSYIVGGLVNIMGTFVSDTDGILGWDCWFYIVLHEPEYSFRLSATIFGKTGHLDASSL
jgi:hypothetical protein